ncbi:MAG: hypothetical protein BRC40_02390 [Cyanobacteria bacterium QH_8_48_120]|nr:MAG: hypothetical protein BRC40_02390 [Cyanobacteria bacterium QH_8_48_120]
MKNLPTQVPTDIWVTASWEEYIEIVSNSLYEKGKCYYHDGQLRIEMAPVGYDHSSDNTVITLTVSLFGIAKNIPLTGLINCSYRQQGKRECQPDLSYYLGERAQVIPYGTKIVSLNQYPPPDLAIEVGDSSLEDYLNRKKQLYQELQVSEYWVVDVEKVKLLAFSVSQEDTPEITQSRILPELETSLLEEALRRSRTSNQTEVGTWLMQQFQGK